MILPLTKYLESHGVKIEYGVDVKNVTFASYNMYCKKRKI